MNEQVTDISQALKRLTSEMQSMHEAIDAHVGFLHLLGSIIKRGGGVLHGRYCHYHIGSEDSTI